MKSLFRRQRLAVSLLAAFSSRRFSPRTPGRRRSSSGSRSARTSSSPTTGRSRRTSRRSKAASPRVEIEVLGKTTLGEDMFMAVISSEENIRNLEAHQGHRAPLADPRGLSDARRADARARRQGRPPRHLQHPLDRDRRLADGDGVGARARDGDGRRDEVKRLRTTSSSCSSLRSTPTARSWRRSGTARTSARSSRGAACRGSTTTTSGTTTTATGTCSRRRNRRRMTRAVYQEWFPQVWLDEHQMGSNGPRIFVPPYADPVDTTIHPLVWREVNLIGSNMALRLEQAGKSGVIYGFSYDAYWPGGTKNTAWYKNISGLLTEVASARIATPIEIARRASSPAAARAWSSTARRRTSPTRGRAAHGGCATSWITSASPPTRCSRSCADRREDFLRDMAARARAAIAALAGRSDAYRIPGGRPARPCRPRCASRSSWPSTASR